MKRNKRTEVVAQVRLTPLTDHILKRMGLEGTVIRQRLRRFYQERHLGRKAPCESGRGAPT